MSMDAPARQFLDALLAVLPGAQSTEQRRQAWHSAGLSGERVTVALQLWGGEAGNEARRTAARLPEMQFRLDQAFVADIAVTDIADHADGAIFRIEALLVEE